VETSADDHCNSRIIHLVFTCISHLTSNTRYQQLVQFADKRFLSKPQ